MKQKRALVWMTVLALLLSLIPFGAASTVQAAATFFIPDNTGIAQTSGTTLTTLDRQPTHAYTTTDKTITIDGTYNFVDKDTMTVTVDSLLQDPTNPGTFSPDPGRTYSKAVTSSSTNRFDASNLDMYPGFNRVTFTGMQAGVQKTDTFFILYDQAPYLQSLQVIAGYNTPVNLNQGASMVVDTQQVSLQGVAANATSVVINGIVGSVQNDGTFFSPTLTLTPGLNTISLTISNSANKVDITRTLYYYDPNKPFIQLGISTATDASKSLIDEAYNNGKPPVITDPSGQASLHVQFLAPYSATPFSVNSTSPSATVTLNGNSVAAPLITDPPADSQTPITGSDGTTLKYRLISFDITNYQLEQDSSTGTYATNQPVTLDIQYPNGNDAKINAAFTYYPNDKVIQKVSLITDNRMTASPGNIDNTYTTVPLDGSEVTSPTFYVVVEADKNIQASTTPALTAALLPLSTSSVTVTPIGDSYDQSGTVETNKKVYKISNFPAGNQKLSFRFADSSSSYLANVSYVSKDYIIVDSISDGQTVSFDSRTIPSTGLPVDVKGAFAGNDPLVSANFSVNANPYPIDSKISTGGNFDFDLWIGGSQPNLVVGLNTLDFTAQYQTGSGLITVNKEMKLYVVDTNVPTISILQPTGAPTSGPLPSLPTMSENSSTIDSQIQLVTADPNNNFIYQNSKYVTSLKTYNLVLRATGAKHILLKRGADVVLDLDYGTLTPGTLISGKTNDQYNYEYAGSPQDLILRIDGIQFAAPESHVYSLELTNATGAKVSQRLEVERVVSSYRLISPQKNSGDSIVVNKNFIRFDIEAEGAQSVLVDGKPATPRDDIDNRYIYDYIGLKPDKDNQIKIQVKRAGSTTNDVVTVFYTSDVNVNSEYMEKISTKHNVFNKGITLTFPKGTVLKSVVDPSDTSQTTRYYDKTNLLFGIADPNDGVVGRRNDYGNILGIDNDARTNQGLSPIYIASALKSSFTNLAERRNFARVSPVYWISGGLAETAINKPTDGIEPYSVEGTYTMLPADRKVVPTKRGSLTLHYDDSVVDAAGVGVTVFYLNDQGRWINLGGEVNTKNNTITVPFDNFGYYMVEKQKSSFSDVTNHPWARNVLDALYAKGYMTNLYFALYGADDYATRGEFATLLVKSLNLPLTYDNIPTFTDVGPGAMANTWDYAHIETAARAGIINGIDGQFFGPNMQLTREQAATMIARALNLKLALNDSKLAASLSKAFTDEASMSYYALPYIDAVAKAGIIVGKPNDPTAGQKKPTVYFDPTANLTRAEAGQIAVRLLQKSTKIFPSNLN